MLPVWMKYSISVSLRIMERKFRQAVMCVLCVATRFFIRIIDRDANECYYIMLVKANQKRGRYAKYSGKNDQRSV